MRPPRFTIASLLLLIVFLGVGFAALRSPSPLWANAWFSIALAILTVAVLAAIYRRGKRRAFWVGFASCGWMYFLLAFGGWYEFQACPYLVTPAVLDILYEHLVPPDPPPLPVTATPSMMGAGGGTPGGTGMPASGMIGGGMGGGIAASSRWAEWTEPDRNTDVGGHLSAVLGGVALMSPEPFRRIGHCLFCLSFAAIGGVLTGRLYSTRDQPETQEAR